MFFKLLKQSRSALLLTFFTILLIGLILYSLTLGRFTISSNQVLAIVLEPLFNFDIDVSSTQEKVVELVRIPRIICASLIGAALAIAGTALQGVLRNPLIGPNILGVISAASFGGALAILMQGSSFQLILSAFALGIFSIIFVRILSTVNGRSSVIMLVLSGVIISFFFTGLISLIKFVADPENQLPEIVYWLMGSLARVNYEDVQLLLLTLLPSMILIFLLRYRIDILSTGEEEATTLGISVERNQWAVFSAVTLISAAVVSVAGIISWVGLIIPHFARMLVGPNHKILLPVSAVIGAIYLLIIDNLARTMTATEIPLSILTSIVGVPIFAVLVRKTHNQGWKND